MDQDQEPRWLSLPQHWFEHQERQELLQKCEGIEIPRRIGMNLFSTGLMEWEGRGTNQGDLRGKPVMVCFCTSGLMDGGSHPAPIFCGVTRALSDWSASHLWSDLIGWSLCQSNKKRV